MRDRGARHGDGIALVAQAVLRLRFRSGALTGFWFMPAVEAAALDHEAVDDAMENRVVVVAGLDVGEEVGAAPGCLFGIEFEGDGAMVGVSLIILFSLVGLVPAAA
jgi:hypothetical protein